VSNDLKNSRECFCKQAIAHKSRPVYLFRHQRYITYFPNGCRQKLIAGWQTKASSVVGRFSPVVDFFGSKQIAGWQTKASCDLGGFSPVVDFFWVEDI
jgi:hypothetical protein